MHPDAQRFQQILKMRHLRLLLTLEQCDSIKAAAEQLNVSQAAVSKACTELEHLLGGTLFERQRNQLRPTPVGVRMIAGARRILAEVDALGEELMLLHAGAVGTVRIGMQTISAQPFIADVNTRFKAQYPNITLRFGRSVLAALFDDLRQNRIDLVFGRLTQDALDPIFANAPIVFESTVVVASRGHPVARHAHPDWRDLVRNAWILPQPGTPIRDYFDRFLAGHGLIAPANLIETDDWLSMTSLLQAGDYLALVPRGIARRWHDSGVASIVPINVPRVAGPIGMVWRTDQVLPPSVALYRDHVLQQIALSQDASSINPDKYGDN